MKYAFMGYRDWAKKIKSNLELVGFEFTSLNKADVVLYYGWSKIVPAEISEDKLCLILHPSPLPKYRGGSPLQHQIMAGEKNSAVTILKAEKSLDTGDIYSQTKFSLEGTLDDIFKRIVEIGSVDTFKVLTALEKGKISPKSQKGKASTFKRRTPEQSEIKGFKSAKDAYNFIRALNDPYPNAFIKCKDGKKLYITGAHL